MNISAFELKILILEDTPLHAGILKEGILKKLPRARIKIFDTGREAHQYLQTNQTDMILCDYALPDMTGLEFIRRLKKSGLLIPVLFISAQEREDLILEAMQEGALDFIIKPTRLELLYESMHRVLDKVLLHKELQLLRQRYQGLQENLLHQDRMAKLGLMTSGVVHEFNNILSSLSAYASMATLDPQRYHERLPGLVVEQTKRAVSLATSLLSFSRRGVDPKEEVDLGHLLQDVKELIERNFWQKQVELTLRLQPVRAVLASPGCLQQVFMNLLLNALEAVGPAGRVEVCLWETGHQAVVEFQDNGPGIKPENQRKIFEPFFSTKTPEGAAKRKGSGLGLFFCREIVSSCGGRIEVQSREGGGSKFTVRLPLMQMAGKAPEIIENKVEEKDLTI